MTIQAMNHFTVLARDLAATKAFYIGLLGLTDGPRPPFDFPGAWLYVGNQAVLHIVAGRPIPAHRRRQPHHWSDIEIMRRQAGNGPWQLFCHDPNGAKVELDFSPDEAAPAAS